MELDLLGDKEKLQSLKQFLHQYTAPAAEELIQREANGDIRCFACGHRCLVKPGRDGVCRVRFNDNGRLLVPFGYVAGVACDPIEKKPFFHVLPGSDALSFGMLGCDLHCGYCFTPETVVMTDRGPMRFDALFELSLQNRCSANGEIALPLAIRTIAASGLWRRIEGVFKHPYRGKLAIVRPCYLPELRCTPDHSVYATDDPNAPPRKIEARHLTPRHYLAVPRRHQREWQDEVVDVAQQLSGHQVIHKTPWELSLDERTMIATESAAGASSREISAALGKSSSYIRHVRCKLAGGRGGDTRTGAAILETGTVRFPKEHRPGIPAAIPLDEHLARLLGYYCAEGSVVKSTKRPNSHVLNFSFSLRETTLAEEVQTLLKGCLNINGRLVHRSTTLAVAASKTSAALLFKTLCGSRATGKHVPPQVFHSSPAVMRAFLDACVRGDGHRYPNGKVSLTTVSSQLAHGLAFLALSLGHMPSIYDTPMEPDGRVLGRSVRRSPHQYTVVWYEMIDTPPVERWVVETDDFHLIPLRDITFTDYDGDVYNMQVEQENNYLANLMLVANCQNWVTSQMLRDADAVAPPKLCRPEQLVEVAVQHGAPVVASTYNEPLITSEWAMAVFKAARAKGLRCAYISNGNATPQVLDYLRPAVDCYKVDLKTFNPRNYRQLGGVLENITDSIRQLKERGFWVEIVTLVVPGFSDDPDDLKRMAEFLASVDPLMPWHVTAFHPNYKMTDGYRRTTAGDLMRIVEYARNAGMKYLYLGNLPGQVGEWENTRCHGCNATLIRRQSFLVQENRIGADGLCPECGTTIPGVWGRSSGHGDGRIRPIA